MAISEYGKRYFESEKFIEFCNHLEVKLLDWRMETEWLEHLEKEKLLFPRYRIVLPRNYSLYISKRYYIPKEKLSPKWLKIRTITDNIEEVEYSFNIFNILDKKKIAYKRLEIPKESRFRKWSYKFKDGKHEKDIYNLRNYFQHWQIYHLFELTMACTQYYLINVFNENILDERWKKGLNTKRIFRSPITFRFRDINYFDENLKLFEMLSFYVSAIINCNTFPLEKWREYDSLDEKFRYDLEHHRDRRIARITISKFNLNKQILIEFIKSLCNRYFIYEKEGMNKLIEMMKKDIGYMCRLLEDGFGFEIVNLIEEVGKVSEHYYQKPLEYILRGEIAEAKENAYRSLKDIIGKTIKYENLITEDEVNEFLEFCDSNSMGSIFLEINRFYWGSQTYYGIIQNLISLTMAFEGFLRIILEKEQIKITGKNLINVIRLFYENAIWIKEFNRYFESINQKGGLEELSNKIMNQKFHKNNSDNEIIKVLYIVRAIRNEIAHSPFNIRFKKIHPNFYKEKVIELIWYSWRFAKEKYPYALKSDKD
ncbi:MAG: hypothetical protein DAHOPDDO_00776 [Ignavibacteriaceae bacterium]|nr:hypothetical protein [Ignavibacteriaceae bacterium]